MSAIEKMKEMQANLDLIEENIAKLQESTAIALVEMESERDKLKEKLSFGVAIANELEEKVSEQRLFDSEALATLYISNQTDADFIVFCDATSIELPPALEAELSTEKKAVDAAA